MDVLLICRIIILNIQKINKPIRTFVEFQALHFCLVQEEKDTTENNGSNRLKTRDDISQILRQFISRVRAFLKIFVDLSYDERPARR